MEPQFTLEELMAEKQRRQQLRAGGQSSQTKQLNVSMPNNLAPQQQQGQDTMLGGLLDKINPGLRNSLYGALASGASGKVVDPRGEQTDLSKLYAQEAIKKQFEDPTVRQLREAEIASLQQPLPEGVMRVGRQVMPDPSYVKPPNVKEQLEMDEANKANEMASESIRSSAEQSLSNIQKAKEGSKFFGPMGGVPTIADPQSLLGLNTKHYSERKDWENNVNQLLSQKVVDLIAEMKRVSKTGATGFGQLSEQEGALLRNASTALSRDLPPDQAVYYLNEMEKIQKKILGMPVDSGGTPLTSTTTNVSGYDPDKESRYQAWKQSQGQ